MNLGLLDLDKFRASIDMAQSIVITAHLYPDYDAVCSAILLSRTLRFNYPEKKVHVVFEDRPRDGVVGKQSNEIRVMPILDSLRHYNADCLILADTGYFNKATRGDISELLSFIKQKGIKALVIDHHEGVSEDGLTAHIQAPSLPAATQLVYQVCFQGLGLSRPSNIAQITMIGIVDDSGLFTYPYDYSDTFKVVEELINSGASIEQASFTVNQLTLAQMKVIADLANNMKVEADYAYSFVSDELLKGKLLPECDTSDFKVACTMFVNKYIKAVKGVEWGFIIYPASLSLTSNEYRVSFRSHEDAERDITLITSSLGGRGGHKYASGANVLATNMLDALDKVKKAILESGPQRETIKAK